MTLKDFIALEGHSLLNAEPQEHLDVPSLQTSLKILAHRTTLKYLVAHHHLDEGIVSSMRTLMVHHLTQSKLGDSLKLKLTSQKLCTMTVKNCLNRSSAK